MDECCQIGIGREKLYTKMSTMGYIGPPMALLCLDRIRKEEQLNHNDLILSFVTEVSKFMQAGYCLRQVGNGQLTMDN
jgi:3-oxoacyl-[acyl-carrier-protein] synthase III